MCPPTSIAIKESGDYSGSLYINALNEASLVQMLRALCQGLLVLSLLFSASAIELEFPRCNCDGDSIWSIESILQCQKVSDFLIAVAYFSIPLELLYFATCSNLFPFKWVVIQFSAFIVLCGLTHLLNVFTYEPHSFLLMLSLSVSKFFTALVSFATAITLLTLIPQLLRVKLRENFLRIKARDLDREVGMMKRQEEASWHVRMLTQEIRKSLDRHTILYTTLVELSNTLGLQNCAVWMPDENKKEMNLTHELRQRNSLGVYGHSIPSDDPVVTEIKETKGVKILRPDCLLGSVSSGGELEPGAVAAIRMPMLKVSNFKGGTPKLIQACYAILVLVLPNDDSRVWSDHELEIIEVVADQVAVALSHAAVLEESQLMRDKLAEQNRVLLQAKQNAMMASEARNSFQRAMSQGMRKPIHSILGLLSMIQQEKLSSEQRLIINAMTKTSGVVSTLTNDVMETNTINSERLTLEMRPFKLHSMIKEAASVARCLCDCRGFGFGFQVDNAVTNLVVGDEKRIFHVILHMVGNLLIGCDQGFVTFSVSTYNEVEDRNGQGWFPWKSNFSDGYTCVKFEIGIKRSKTDDSSSSYKNSRKLNSEGLDMGLRFNMCKKLVQAALVEKSVNIRFLAIDAVEKTNSGHPGLPMGCAPMGHILYDEVMRYNPKNPYWFNRDRFVLSAGHRCMLQYALRHLAGYDSVKMMQGNIWAVPDSKGLPESITLILQFQLQPLTPLSEPGGSSEHHHPPSTPNFKGLRVLMVDSDDVDRAITRKLLEKLGCQVTSVSSGIQCLSSLSAYGTPFQLVILDIQMAEMEGFELVSRIRKLRSGCWPLIVVLTASTGEEPWQRCSQSGINGMIRRPVTLHAVGDELYRVLHSI